MESMVERFVRYTSINTRSNEEVQQFLVLKLK